VNDSPHVGHAYTTVNADAVARWHRLAGDDVYFLTGTDEHGDKVARAAQEHGMSTSEWVDATSLRFVEAWQDLDISNDDFIRTTEPRHFQAVQKFLQRIYDNGFIELGTYAGWYCVGCESYKDESELLDGHVCPDHLRPVEWLEQENYFFKLSAFQDRLLEWYEQNPDAVRPVGRRNEALGFIKGGLEDISITRTSTKWGVPVPWDDRHVFYVWYDALINYLTAIGYGEDDERFNSWWSSVHHFLAKDILRFHCVWWPAMCMAAGIDPPAHLFVHGWLLVSGRRLSKTLVREVADATAVAGGEPPLLKLTEIAPVALTEDFGVDPVRYYLLRDATFGSDGDFSYEGITARYNSDLANNLGNLMARVSTVVGSKCGGIGPVPDPSSRLSGVATDVLAETASAWAEGQPHTALEATWRLIHETNAELELAEPWKSEPGPAVDAVLGSALEALRIVALLAWPAMPATSTEIWRRLGLPGDPAQCRVPQDARWGGYPGGLAVERGSPLFPRRQQ
jgi:methionyl-tRNA synthetase